MSLPGSNLCRVSLSIDRRHTYESPAFDFKEPFTSCKHQFHTIRDWWLNSRTSVNLTDHARDRLELASVSRVPMRGQQESSAAWTLDHTLHYRFCTLLAKSHNNSLFPDGEPVPGSWELAPLTMCMPRLINWHHHPSLKGYSHQQGPASFHAW